MKCNKHTMLLYAVTDRQWSKEQTLYQQANQAISGGITCLQLREKGMSEAEFLNEAIEIKKLCNKNKIPFIINDNLNIAIKCKADGIHVGQSDTEVAEVRKTVGKDMIIGASVQTVEQALKAQHDGADYLGVGAIFSTSTKLDADSVSYDTLKKICEIVSIPVVAIGGISEDNIMQLKGSGIDGVALVSAIFSSKDIKNTCEKLYKLSKEVVDYGN